MVTEIKPMFVVAIGSIAYGYHIAGPFESRDAALDWVNLKDFEDDPVIFKLKHPDVEDDEDGE